MDQRIERIDRETLEARLRDVARALCPERVMDDLEVSHLARVLHECAVLLGDVYSDDRIAGVLQPGSDPASRWIERLLHDESEEQEMVRRVRRLPDDARMMGDKALFDHGLLGLHRVKGHDLVELGARAYMRAGQLLELLAEDRRLQSYFKDNRLLMLPLEEEVVFLRQCSDNFRHYANILKHTHGASDTGVSDMASRVPLMAAAAAALEDEPIELDVADDESYLEAARGESSAESGLSKERLISAYERILLFSSLDMARLRETLDATVIDQQEAVEQLCDDFGLHATGTRDPRKPPAYFLVGPTGVGKNYLVESLVRLLEGVWDAEIPTLTIEGPNYTYPSDINELRGATRGFIRSDEEGVLTAFHNQSSKAPLGVILVDEVEKAHPHLLSFFLSILDRGTTTDNRGDLLDFSNCIVFFTSNMGYSDAQQGSQPIGYGDEDKQQRAADGVVRRGLRSGLKPEFMNRVRTVHFHRLGRASAERILDLELDRIARRYLDLHGLTIELGQSAREELLRRGFSPEYGARHLAATLEGVCNVEIAKKMRQDDRSEDGDSEALLAWLREVKSGERAFTPEEIRERVQERTRAQLDYDTLRVEFEDDAFVYVTESRS